MGEIQEGMNVDDADRLPKQKAVECGEVVDGIVRGLEAGKEDVRAEDITTSASESSGGSRGGGGNRGNAGGAAG
ncbi:MAG: hypothetical protein P8Z42_05185, partial [Anaerolineales bacterium]